MHDGNVMSCGFGEQVPIGGGIFIASDPQLTDLKIIQHGSQAIDVVVMRVREQNHIEALNSARPKIRRDDLFADVEAGVIAADVYFASQPAAVDEHGALV